MASKLIAECDLIPDGSVKSINLDKIPEGSCGVPQVYNIHESMSSFELSILFIYSSFLSFFHIKALSLVLSHRMERKKCCLVRRSRGFYPNMLWISFTRIC